MLNRFSKWTWGVIALTLARAIMIALMFLDVPKLDYHVGWAFYHGGDEFLYFKVANDILAGKLTVREAENEARRLSGRELKPRKRFGSPGDIETRGWQDKLQEMFGTKVLVQKLGDHGKIVIEFYSDEELRAIVNKVLQERGEGSMRQETRDK